MSNLDELSRNPSQKRQTAESKWDKSIEDARYELAEAEKRVGRLKAAIRIFMDNKANRVPWPTDAPLNGQGGD